MFKNTTSTQKFGAFTLLANVAFLSVLLKQRSDFSNSEIDERREWEGRNKDDFECFLASKRYYDQCRYKEDEEEDCLASGLILKRCKVELGQRLPEVTVAMRPLPMALRPV